MGKSFFEETFENKTFEHNLLEQQRTEPTSTPESIIGGIQVPLNQQNLPPLNGAPITPYQFLPSGDLDYLKEHNRTQFGELCKYSAAGQNML